MQFRRLTKQRTNKGVVFFRVIIIDLTLLITKNNSKHLSARPQGIIVTKTCTPVQHLCASSPHSHRLLPGKNSFRPPRRKHSPRLPPGKHDRVLPRPPHCLPSKKHSRSPYCSSSLVDQVQVTGLVISASAHHHSHYPYPERSAAYFPRRYPVPHSAEIPRSEETARQMVSCCRTCPC